MRESWKIHFQRNEIPFEWIVHQEGRLEKTAKKILPESLVVLLNDHHLDELTGFLRSTGRHGRGRDDGLWVGVSTEKVIGSVFPESEEKTKACAGLCHLMAHFDPLAADLIRGEGADALFVHQYADSLTFRPWHPFAKKQAGVLWVGKLPAGQTPGEYDRRARLFEAVRGRRGFFWRQACHPDLPIQKIVRERDFYQGLLNLPSNCPGYTATFFEHLAMGAVVLQYRTGTPWPEGLAPGRHFLEYDPDRPEELVARLEEVLKDPGQFSRMASEGQQACLARHTLQHRLQAIFRRLHTLQPAPWLESLVEKLESH